MTKDEVIALAREAGIKLPINFTDELQHALQAAYRKGVEDSAKVCEKMDAYYFDGYEDRHNLPDDCAYEIRKLIADTDKPQVSDGAIGEQG